MFGVGASSAVSATSRFYLKYSIGANVSKRFMNFLCWWELSG